MKSQPEALTHKALLRRAFDRAADTYNGAAQVQREICEDLMRLGAEFPSRHSVNTLLDAGCGTGYALAPLQKRFDSAKVLALDFAPAMLQHIPGSAYPICADIEAIPLAEHSVDAVFSSLALQWCRPQAAMQAFAHVLAPGGVCWIATLGPHTLHELRRAFAAVDSAEHVMHFHGPEIWREAALCAGFEQLALRRRQYSVRADNLRGIIRHIKSIGAHRPARAPRKPLTRRQWRQLEACYETYRHGGELSATYDAILMALRRPRAKF